MNKTQTAIFMVVIVLVTVCLMTSSKSFQVTSSGIVKTDDIKIGSYLIYEDNDGDLVAFNERTESFAIIAYGGYDSTTVPMEDQDENQKRLRNKQ